MDLKHLTKMINWSKQKDLFTIFALKRELKKSSKNANTSTLNESQLTTTEQDLIHRIKIRTAELNQNNVTRTNAYLEFYRRHPEIHWALLGHMVSRNGGWNMTDLRGELLTRLLSEQEQNEFFSFLERGNWLIFQDVYPQFLLYEESLRRKRNLFYLLPFFRVSVFMKEIWNHFWKKGNCYLLAIALVINEQSYLEHRVVQNPYYQKTVLKTYQFKLQDLLSLNQILFPLERKGNVETNKPIEIIGTTLHYFSSLHERIRLGKRLYRLLFADQIILDSVVQWASNQSHSGSRADYWPHLFNTLNESAPTKLYRPRIDNCQLKVGASRLYSPTITRAWPNIEHEAAELGDWYKDWKVLLYLIDREDYVEGEIYETYCETLEKIELAVMGKSAKNAIVHRDGTVH